MADIIRNARPTSSESAIDKGSLYRILRNRVYIGLAVHKGVAYPPSVSQPPHDAPLAPNVDRHAAEQQA